MAARAPQASAGEPFQSDVPVRVGDVLIQNADGRWVPAGRRGAPRAAASTALAPSPAASSAAAGGATSASVFAAARGLSFTDHGTYAILEREGVRIRLYADSRQGLVATRSFTFKEPVARRGQDLMLPPNVVHFLDREIGDELARSKVARELHEARRNGLAERRLSTPAPAAAIGSGSIEPGSIVPTPITPRPIRRRPSEPPVARTTTPTRGLAGWVPSASAPRREWKWIVLHHSDDLSGGAAKYDRVHRQDNGWEHGLGYHFVIGNGSQTGDGEVEVGSRWSQQLHGAHAKTPDNRYNDHGVGICLVGDFDVPGGRPSSAQMDSLVRLVRWLTETYRIPTDAVLGHCDCSVTKCPGCNFPWEELRRRIR